jgi:putative ABC transport system permease protein
VQAVGATSRLPRRRGGPAEQPMIIIGREVRSAADMAMADHSGVTPDYFRAMGIPLLRGRAFEESDRLNTAPVFIINEALAKRYFPNQDPIGQRMSFPSRTNRFAPEESYQNGFPVIVGVVADVSTLSLNPETHPHFYSPYWQYPMQSPTVTATRDRRAPGLGRAKA